LELLVAATILCLLVVLLMTIVSQTTLIVAKVDAQKSRRQTARLALELITRDLEAAAFPLIPTSTNSLQFLRNPTGIPLNRDAAFWQAAVPGDSSASDLSEVGYFVAWTTNAGHLVGELRRLRVPPNAADSIFQNPADWLTMQKLTDYAPGSGGVGTNALKGMIAQNVLGLWITLYDTNNAVLSPAIYDSRLTNARPASAEVALVVIDPTAAKRIGSEAVVTGRYATHATPEEFAASFSDMGLQGNLQVFKERVQMHAAETKP
jgi:type II secretory pathway pseudopilin PulG